MAFTKFPQTVDEFVSAGISLNPLFNGVVANMQMTRALQKALNAQSLYVKSIAAEIDRVGSLSVKIQSYRQNKTDTSTKIDFGTNNEDAKNMIEQMIANGVDPKDLANMQKLLDENKRVQIDDETIQKITAQLGARIDSLNSKSSQEQLTLQTLTNRYTQSGEQASNVLQKDSQSKGTIISNSRGMS